MQLDYKILWIDDEENGIATNQAKIEEEILALGFKPKIDYFTTLEDNIMDTIQEYDIVFVDYQLSGNKNGDAFIEEVRRLNIYTNIVFYSSDPEKIIEETSEKRLSGVYIFDREQFNDEDILDLIRFFLKKDMNEHTMRGIVMSEIARFDALIWELLNNKKMNGVELCKDCVSKRVKNQKEQSWNNIKDISPDDLWALIEDKGTILFDSALRAIVLHADMIGKKELCKDEKNMLCNPYCDLLKARNDLAHKLHTDFPDNHFLNLRKKLLEFRNLFENLEAKLENKDD